MRVSILARLYRRALSGRRLERRLTGQLFQSSPAFTGGRLGIPHISLQIYASFNPRPPLQAGA